MRINEEYMLRNIAGEVVIVPTGDASQHFNGLLTLNEVGLFIWKKVDEVDSREDIICSLMDEYEVDIELATKDVNGFLDMLKEYDILVE